MTIAEVLLFDYDHEMRSTRTLLERVPANEASYTCHPKSMPLGKLAMHVATLPGFALGILTTPEMDLATFQFPDMTYTTQEHMLETFDQLAAKARQTLVEADDASLMTIWTIRFGERVIARAPRAALYRTMFLNHLIHHRAQLSVYLRLNDIPVPGLYGPSADEPFQP
ncbi:MAG: hypothetical protein KGK08_03910 [Acidobacteriota bacterium]|nr:hypothetical protein [Acidobacteriota bacterium]